MAVLVQYKAVDFPSGMVTKTTSARSVIKALQEHPGWQPILFCDGPHMLGPVLVLARHVDEEQGQASAASVSASPTAQKKPKAESEYVCSDCGGSITANDKTCPHCGAAIEEG